MRLIDADALGIGRCNPDAFPLEGRAYCAGWNGVINLIEQAPTVEAVPVVRCKDCKHYGCEKEPSHGTVYHFCKRHKGLVVVRRDTYCSYGERKK